MIHSLSGGVIAENTPLTFLKVEIEGAPYWYYLTMGKVQAGDTVLVPFKNRTVRATVVRVESGTQQTAPLPLSRMKEIEGII